MRQFGSNFIDHLARYAALAVVLILVAAGALWYVHYETRKAERHAVEKAHEAAGAGRKRLDHAEDRINDAEAAVIERSKAALSKLRALRHEPATDE